jgi:Transposase IS66 family
MNAQVPPAASAGDGPRFTALLGELSGRQRSRRRAVQACWGAGLGLPSRQGAMHRAVGRGAEALPPPDEAMAEQARSAPGNARAETAWSPHGGLAWLWGLVTTTAAWCKGQPSRRQAAFEALVAHWAGILVSAGSTGSHHGVHGRRACLAQLRRRARGLAARHEPELAWCGGRVLAESPRLVPWAQAPPTAGAVPPWSARLVQVLEQYRRRKDAAGRLARTLERELGARWTLVVDAGVEPPNNRAERTRRCAVRWRGMRQGTDTAPGDRGVERSLSVRETCRLRGVPTVSVLVDAVTCDFTGQPPEVSWIEGICPPEPIPGYYLRRLKLWKRQPEKVKAVLPQAVDSLAETWGLLGEDRLAERAAVAALLALGLCPHAPVAAARLRNEAEILLPEVSDHDGLNELHAILDVLATLPPAETALMLPGANKNPLMDLLQGDIIPETLPPAADALSSADINEYLWRVIRTADVAHRKRPSAHV